MKLDWRCAALVLAGGDTVPGIERVVLDAREAWTRALPAFVADLSESAVPHTLFRTELVRHAKFLSTTESCILFGSHHFHAVLQDSGLISLHDTDMDRVLFRLNLHISNQAGQSIAIPRIEAQGQGFVCTTDFLSASDVIKIQEPVFFGSPVEPDNFGMWLMMGLPSIDEFARRARGEKYMCWIGSSWQRQLLNFLGVRDDQIIVQEPWKLYEIDCITMHQYSHVDVTPVPSDQEVFQKVRDTCLDVSRGQYEKIFVSRRSFTRKVKYRALLNEDELIVALEARGFVTVEPEKLDFATQVRLFASARVVVGLGGAAMFNCIFCEPGSAVVSIEGSGAFVYGHANLFAASRLDFGFIFGSQDQSDAAPVHKMWTINVPEAVRHIEAFI